MIIDGDNDGIGAWAEQSSGSRILSDIQGLASIAYLCGKIGNRTHTTSASLNYDIRRRTGKPRRLALERATSRAGITISIIKVPAINNDTEWHAVGTE